MSFIVSAVMALNVNPPDMETGWASQYNPGVMRRVIHSRQHGCCGRYSLPAILPDVDGYVAVADRERIGDVVWVRRMGFKRWERFLVADCAGVRDGGLSWMRANRILVEVDHATALRWGTVGRGVRVEVSWTDPYPTLREMGAN